MAETKTTTKTKKPDVEVFIPKGGRNEPNFIIVSLNGKSYQVMRGVKVKVPYGVAQIIKHSEQAEAEAESYIDGTASE